MLSRLRNSEDIGGKIKRALVFFLPLLLAVSGCGFIQEDVSSGRDMKLLLDARGLDCEAFEVENDLVTNGEILTCLDGSLRNEPFSFIIWPSTEARDLGLTNFCLDLKSRGNAEKDFIVESTWVAYSSSSFLTAEDLADDLGAAIVTGEAFCVERGLEIGARLSKERMQTCDSIYKLHGDLKEISVREAVLVTGENVGTASLYFGSMSNVDKGTLSRMNLDLLMELGTLKTDPDIPGEIREKVDAVDHLAVHAAPLYLFTEIPSWAKGKPALPRAQALKLLDEINAQYIDHNVRVADFNIDLSSLNSSLTRVLDACRLYAEFDW